MKKLLVTGASGFVGSRFVRQAGALYDVVPMSRPYSTCPELDIDLVVHLGALTAKSSGDQTPLAVFRRENVLATQQLLGSLPSTVSYFLYVSTTDVRVLPLTSYAQSKKEAEDVVRGECARRGIACGIARLGSIYGPGESSYGKVIPTFLSLARQRKPLPVVGNAKRQFLYVDDAAAALLLILVKRYEGILDVVGKHVVKARDVAALVNRISSNPVGVVYTKKNLHDRLTDPAPLEALGFREHVTLAEGLKREYDSLS